MNKTIIRILLGLAACAMAYFCISSVLTPIKFEDQREKREVAVVKNLVALRTAEVEFHHVNNRYTADLDSLVLFLKTAELQLSTVKHILNTAKAKAQRKQKFENEDALYAFVWANDADVKKNGLQGFRRDTIYKNMIEDLYKGEYTADNIDQIIYIPYTDNVRFEVEVNNNYTTSQGIRIPLFEARAHYNTYLADLNAQERVNLIDKETKLEHYPGLKVGDIEAPNNNAGNWE